MGQEIVPITVEIQVYYVDRAWHWRRVNLLTSQVLADSGVTTFTDPYLAKAAALIAHPGSEIAYFWVSESGPEWKRYQDA